MKYKYQALACLSAIIFPKADFQATLHRFSYEGEEFDMKKPMLLCQGYHPEQCFTMMPGVDKEPLWEAFSQKSLPDEDLPIFNTLDEVIGFIQETWGQQAKAAIDDIKSALPASKSQIIQRFI